MNSDQKTDKQYAEKGQMISELCDFFWKKHCFHEIFVKLVWE